MREPTVAREAYRRLLGLVVAVLGWIDDKLAAL